MGLLTSQQKQKFADDGVLFVEQAISGEMLSALQDEFAGWLEESRKHDAPWGDDTVDGRPRFDIEPGHSSDNPALRRVNSPIEVSDIYYRAMADSGMTDMVAELIGPAIKFHHAKINSKLPGAKTQVKWHQDFPFTPHSNDDLITALLFIDDVTEENGPLEVVPATHKGEIHSLWHNGKFTAAVANDVAETAQSNAVRCLGPAGSCCFMHTRLLHGSTSNLSDRSRTLFICVYSAEDALALSPNPVPSRMAGELVRGQPTGRVRSVNFDIELPELPSGASFFAQQAAQ